MFFFFSDGKTELYIHDRPLRLLHSRSLVATLPQGSTCTTVMCATVAATSQPMTLR